MFYLVAKTSNAETGQPETVVFTLSAPTRVGAIQEAERTHAGVAVASQYRQSWTVAQQVPAGAQRSA